MEHHAPDRQTVVLDVDGLEWLALVEQPDDFCRARSDGATCQSPQRPTTVPTARETTDAAVLELLRRRSSGLGVVRPGAARRGEFGILPI